MASRDIFLLEFAIFIENPYLILIYLPESDLNGRCTLAEIWPRCSVPACPFAYHLDEKLALWFFVIVFIP